jgi:hypothetical protein
MTATLATRRTAPKMAPMVRARTERHAATRWTSSGSTTRQSSGEGALSDMASRSAAVENLPGHRPRRNNLRRENSSGSISTPGATAATTSTKGRSARESLT